MPRGKPTPEPVKEFILGTRQNSPELTCQAIAQKVEGRFGMQIDKATVGRILQQHGLAGSRMAQLPPTRDEGPIDKPNVGQVVRVWEGGRRFRYVRIVSVKTIPASSASTIDFGPLGPEAEVSKRAAEAIGLGSNELARIGIELLDDVVVKLVEPKAYTAAGKRRVGHEVDVFTAKRGPGSEGAWFWLFGANRELTLRVRNPTKYQTGSSRVRVYGWLARTQPANQRRGHVTDAISRGWN